MKARSSKSQKIGIVTKGLVHGSGQKLVIYREFLLGGEIGAEKCVYDILQGRNAFLNYEKVHKFGFLQRGPWFWSKIGTFSRLLF